MVKERLQNRADIEKCRVISGTDVGFSLIQNHWIQPSNSSISETFPKHPYDKPEIGFKFQVQELMEMGPNTATGILMQNKGDDTKKLM